MSEGTVNSLNVIAREAYLEMISEGLEKVRTALYLEHPKEVHVELDKRIKKMHRDTREMIVSEYTSEDEEGEDDDDDDEDEDDDDDEEEEESEEEVWPSKKRRTT
jgi:hypothetical protein